MLLDSSATDPVSRAYLASGGTWVNGRLLGIMAGFVEPGSKVVDLGAFAGEFSLAAAALGCEVLAFEANPVVASMVAASAAVNEFDDLRVLNVAAGDVAATVSFRSNGPWGVVLDPAWDDEDADEPTLQVPVDDVLDALGWTDIAFVKIDVEGSEARALVGLSRRLSGYGAPPVLFESNLAAAWGTGTPARELLDLVEGFGYTLYRIVPQAIIPADASSFQPAVVCDYLALKERTPSEVGLATQPPPSLDELVNQIWAEASLESVDHRKVMAWHLHAAPREIIGHRRVQALLQNLRDDDGESVRAAAAWSGNDGWRADPSPPVEHEMAGPAAHTIDPRIAAERALRLAAESRLKAARWEPPSKNAIEATPDSRRPKLHSEHAPGPRAMARAKILLKRLRRG